MNNTTELQNELAQVKLMLKTLLKRMDEQWGSTAPKIYTNENLCEYLHIDRKTLGRLRAYGQINYAKVGKKILYTQADIDTFIDKNKWQFN